MVYFVKGVAILLFITFLCGCGHPDWKHHALPLTNNIGIIEMDLIPEFDTLLKWSPPIEFKCDRDQRYRFQNSRYPIALETGWGFIDCKDSIFNLTIGHGYYSECREDKIKDIDSMVARFAKFLFQVDSLRTFTVKETVMINSIQWGVVGFKDSGNFCGNKSENLVAIAMINGWGITLHFVKGLHTSYKGDFTKDSYDMLKTVRFRKE